MSDNRAPQMNGLGFNQGPLFSMSGEDDNPVLFPETLVEPMGRELDDIFEDPVREGGFVDQGTRDGAFPFAFNEDPFEAVVQPAVAENLPSDTLVASNGRKIERTQGMMPTEEPRKSQENSLTLSGPPHPQSGSQMTG